MKAILCTHYGSSKNLHFTEVERPTPSSSEVLIKVMAASVNVHDWELMRGYPYLARLGSLLKPRHRILGTDVAGVIVQKGSQVTEFQVGDEVFGNLPADRSGSFAEFVSAAPGFLVRKTHHITFEEAAAVPYAGVLALQALRESGQIPDRQNILINGAGGGVGAFAIQLAKIHQAEVTAVDHPDKLSFALSLGAHYAIDYQKIDYTTTNVKYDVIIDLVANRPIVAYRRALASNGRLVLIGGGSSFLKTLASSRFSLLGSNKKIQLLYYKANRDDLLFLNELLKMGKIRPVIDRVYGLKDVPQAIDHLGYGHAKGKVVISMRDEYCLKTGQFTITKRVGKHLPSQNISY